MYYSYFKKTQKTFDMHFFEGGWGAGRINYPPTFPLTQHLALSEKYVLTLSKGRGRWDFSHKPELIQKRCMMVYNVKVANDGCDFHSFSTMCIGTV